MTESRLLELIALGAGVCLGMVVGWLLALSTHRELQADLDARDRVLRYLRTTLASEGRRVMVAAIDRVLDQESES